MSKFQDFQGPLQKFQAWNPNFQIPGFQGPVRTLSNYIFISSFIWPRNVSYNEKPWNSNKPKLRDMVVEIVKEVNTCRMTIKQFHKTHKSR